MSANTGIQGLKLHKEVHQYFQAREKNGFNVVYSKFTVEDARKLSVNLVECMAGSIKFDGAEWEVIVPSSHSAGGIPLSVYKPNGLRDKPSIFVYFHGGGNCLGSRKTHEVACKTIAREANCIVLNVEYRLGPEYKIPACNEDAWEAVTWVLANRQAVGGAAESSVGIGGDSAGGQITADICHDITGISYQVLIYPKVDTRLDRPSYIEFKDGPVIPASLLQWFFEMGFEKDYTGIKGIPMARDNFKNLPPALFIVAECDPLRDDSYDYERKLHEAGVETKLILFNGLIHAFFHYPESRCTFLWQGMYYGSTIKYFGIKLYEARPLMGSRDNYLTNGTELDLYKGYMVALMEALNFTRDGAEKFSERVVDFEIALANVTTPRDDDTPVPERVKAFTIAELYSNITDQFDWLLYFNQILNSTGIERNLDVNDEVALYYPPYFRRLFSLLSQTSSRTLRDYLTFRVVHFAAGRLSERYRNIESEYNNRRSGRPVSPPRWSTCVDETTDFLSDAIANAYVTRHFQSESKDSVLATVSDLRTAFGSIIDETTWMDNVTRSHAREKLEVIDSKIGYPDRILNKTGVNLKYKNYVMNNNSFFENLVNGNKLNAAATLKGCTESRSTDDGFSVPAFIVNAFFYPRQNNIIFPAAFLQPPYFSARYPRSINYGSIGSVIGHELTHGFDNDGRQYDKDGNDIDWWSEDSKRNFEARALCIAEQYSSYTIQGVHVNGKITLGEDIADNGALKEAYMAYQLSVARHGAERPLPGVPYTHDQLFFIGYAAGFCNKSRPKYAKLVVSQDTHSPDKYRLIGTLQNSEEFANVFQCRRGTFMNPERKCSVW